MSLRVCTMDPWSRGVGVRGMDFGSCSATDLNVEQPFLMTVARNRDVMRHGACFRTCEGREGTARRSTAANAIAPS